MGSLAGPLGISTGTNVGAVLVGNEQPYALINLVWVHLNSATDWQALGVAPWKEINVTTQDPGVGVLRTRNHPVKQGSSVPPSSAGRRNRHSGGVGSEAAARSLTVAVRILARSARIKCKLP